MVIAGVVRAHTESHKGIAHGQRGKEHFLRALRCVENPGQDIRLALFQQTQAVRPVPAIHGLQLQMGLAGHRLHIFHQQAPITAVRQSVHILTKRSVRHAHGFLRAALCLRLRRQKEQQHKKRGQKDEPCLEHICHVSCLRCGECAGPHLPKKGAQGCGSCSNRTTPVHGLPLLPQPNVTRTLVAYKADLLRPRSQSFLGPLFTACHRCQKV